MSSNTSNNIQTLTDSLHKRINKKGRYSEIWGRFRKNRIAMIGLGIFTLVIFCAICADLLVPYEVALEQNIAERLQPPSSKHWFGTDKFGRDILARVIHGTRNSLIMGIGAVFIGVCLGSILGSVSGFFGGKIDAIIMRIIDIFMGIPLILMALTLVAILGPGMINVFIALMVANIPYYTRLVRSVILTIVDQEFIEAARSFGASSRQIITKHILPNAIGPIIVAATMSVGFMILNAAGLSYLGMGIQPPTPEWGAMLSESRDYMFYAPYLVIFPGLAIIFTALSTNLMGDGLRDALDPRLKD